MRVASCAFARRHRRRLGPISIASGAKRCLFWSPEARAISAAIWCSSCRCRGGGHCPRQPLDGLCLGGAARGEHRARRCGRRGIGRQTYRRARDRCDRAFRGEGRVPASVADPLGYYLANTVKSRSLIKAAIRSGVKHFIFSSSAAVYGNPRENPVGEDAPLDPLSPYGRSKLMTEWMLRDAEGAHGLRYARATLLQRRRR